MDLQLTTEQRELLNRVRDYCDAGLTQPEMAKRERLALTTFRLRLLDCGFKIDAETSRRLVRTGTGEEFPAEVLA